jgi:GDP-4-dehydro-6-deoxy-D-mannose reductase
MRVLITGATGFVGGYLAEALLARGQVEVFGVARHSNWPAEWQHLSGKVRLQACDLAVEGAIERVLQEVQPEHIYHLAGYAHVGRSFHEPRAAWEGNLTGTLRLYEGVVRWGGRPRILFVGSGLIYGDPEVPDQPLDERGPLRPASPYAASKAAADLASYQHWRALGMDIVRVRPFNHIGPRQSPQYAVASFAQQIAAIAEGRRAARMETGDLGSRRDLTDVRDMVGAYILLVERGRAGEVYNAGSGEAHTMEAVLSRLRALAEVPIEIRQQVVERRATDTASLCADARKLRREVGWSPRFSLDQTLKDTLEYWRHRS